MRLKATSISTSPKVAELRSSIKGLRLRRFHRGEFTVGPSGGVQTVKEIPENKIEDLQKPPGSDQMSAKMTKLTISSGLWGLLIGAAVTLYAHTGSGFETAPLVFLGLATSAVAGLGSVCLILVFGRRGRLVSAIGVFAVGMLLSLVVVPIIWPYPTAVGPLPLAAHPSASKPK